MFCRGCEISGMDETVEMLSKSVALLLLFVGSLHLVEDARGLLVLGVYVLEAYLGVRLSNSGVVELS